MDDGPGPKPYGGGTNALRGDMGCCAANMGVDGMCCICGVRGVCG
jgi:hypothetical protein